MKVAAETVFGLLHIPRNDIISTEFNSTRQKKKLTFKIPLLRLFVLLVAVCDTSLALIMFHPILFDGFVSLTFYVQHYCIITFRVEERRVVCSTLLTFYLYFSRIFGASGSQRYRVVNVYAPVIVAHLR